MKLFTCDILVVLLTINHIHNMDKMVLTKIYIYKLRDNSSFFFSFFFFSNCWFKLPKDIDEHVDVLSVKFESQDAFEKDFFQLKPYYIYA